MKYVWASMGLCFIYVFVGVVIPYSKQPEISEEYIDSFEIDDFYSDQISNDRAYVIEDNNDALLERLRMIERANDKIILSTFDFKSDNSGKDILASLLNAANNDIDVKILVDGYPAFFHMNNNKYFIALSSHENIEIKIYNSPKIIKPWKSQGRLHDKYLIVDNELYILGGRNTYDFFLGDEGYKNHDRDLLVYNTRPESRQSSIYDLIDYFETVWDYKESKIYHDDVKEAKKKRVVKARQELEDIYQTNIEKNSKLLGDFNYFEYTNEVNKISLLTNPIHIHSKEPTVFYSLVKLMKNAKNDVNIHTPYIVCNDIMYDSFESICNGNADVSIMTNSVANNGNPFGASDYLLNRNKILQTGLNIYEYEGGVSYHAKSITVDDNISIIGSFNIDMRSVYLSTEMMLVVDSEDINKQLNGYMEEYEANAVRIIDKNNIEIPDGVVRQKLTLRKKARIMVVLLFNYLRFLM